MGTQGPGYEAFRPLGQPRADFDCLYGINHGDHGDHGVKKMKDIAHFLHPRGPRAPRGKSVFTVHRFEILSRVQGAAPFHFLTRKFLSGFPSGS